MDTTSDTVGEIREPQTTNWIQKNHKTSRSCTEEQPIHIKTIQDNEAKREHISNIVNWVAPYGDAKNPQTKIL